VRRLEDDYRTIGLSKFKEFLLSLGNRPLTGGLFAITFNLRDIRGGGDPARPPLRQHLDSTVRVSSSRFG
jgi:hypothetical protein